MHLDWEYEVNRLELVKQAIERELRIRKRKKEEYKKQMQVINKDMWEEVGALSGFSSIDEIPTFIQDINMLKQNLLSASENNKRIKMLERLLYSPYFCRIDFKEDNSDTESFYIGVYGFRKGDTGEILIYDWRAPVSSMFYDYEPGRASYKSPSGYIEGELTLKRQYRIENGQLLLMFDSAIPIEDEILQEILASNTNNRMKIIVSTIQKEQNKAIRYEGKRVLAVQGPAGCGKTSIALHRAAYMLYHHRDNLKSENIYLFTPNGVFAKYVSTVLPDLGEDELNCVTLSKLTQKILGDVFKRYESYAEMMEWQLSQKNLGGLGYRGESIRYKTSKEFAAVLERFVEILENKVMQFRDIKCGDVVFAKKEELEELFHNSYRHMPIVRRLARMKMLVARRMEEYKNKKQEKIMETLSKSTEYYSPSEMKILSRIKVIRELEGTKKEVKEMLSVNIAKDYRMLFEDDTIWNLCGGNLSEEARRFTIEALENGILYYEDQPPILYLMALLGMIKGSDEIKHVIIDEAQDYSEVAFKLFSKLYSSCTITLLGDINQNISPVSGIGSLKYAGELIDPDNFEYIELDKSYRSTVEIMEFASRIIDSKVIPYGRNGKVPEILTAGTAEAVCGLIGEHIKKMKEENYRMIAVICRTLSDCCKVYEYLGGSNSCGCSHKESCGDGYCHEDNHECHCDVQEDVSGDGSQGKGQGKDIKVDVPVNLIVHEDDEFPAGVIVIPSYLAKGLEFDAVIAAVLSEDEYITDEDQLFYTVCTRALHRLVVCSVENAGILKKLSSAKQS